jgi:hypothetical protein
VSGTGQYQHHLTPVEQHLGDRLSAFVDGELRDDARDRVLAHLASCSGCKDAADEQRQLKSVVAAADPPALSAGFLARLQGLPGGDDDQRPGPFGDDHGGRGVMGAASLGGERLDGGLFGRSGRPPGEQVSPPFSSGGFRIHQVVPHGRPSESSSSPSSTSQPPRSDSPLSPSPVTGPSSAGRRGRRLAFAAAGAFSTAAIALGAALPLDSAVDGATEDPGPAASPLSTNGDTPRDVDAAGRLIGLWGASGGLGASPGGPPGHGVLRSSMPVLTRIPAFRPLSVPDSGENAEVAFGGSSPAPPFPASGSVDPLLVASAPSPSGSVSGAPATAASVGAMSPMTGGGSRATR